MATIEPYETAAGKRYMVRYRTPERVQRKKRGFRTKQYAKAFAASVRRADIPHVTPHDLRHMAASLAVSAGANVKAVAAALDDARTASVGR